LTEENFLYSSWWRRQEGALRMVSLLNLKRNVIKRKGKIQNIISLIKTWLKSCIEG